MIDPDLKRSLGQLTYGVNVIACRDGDTTRAYTSTWTYQLSFAEPVIGISASPKHDTYPLLQQQRWFTVSLLAGDQIEQAQYFSYPGHKFRYVADYLTEAEGRPVVADCVAWLYAEIVDELPIRDHTLFVAEVRQVGEGRLREPALTYSSRKGWRIASEPARKPGESVRDRLLAMLDDPAG